MWLAKSSLSWREDLIGNALQGKLALWRKAACRASQSFPRKRESMAVGTSLDSGSRFG